LWDDVVGELLSGSRYGVLNDHEERGDALKEVVRCVWNKMFTK